MMASGAGVFRSLRIFNYRVWAGGAFVSNVGAWVQRTAQAWLVLTGLTHHSASAVGTVMALQFGPQLLFRGPDRPPIASTSASSSRPRRPTEVDLQRSPQHALRCSPEAKAKQNSFSQPNEWSKLKFDFHHKGHKRALCMPSWFFVLFVVNLSRLFRWSA